LLGYVGRFGYLHDHLANSFAVTDFWDTQVEGNKVGHRFNESNVAVIAGVEGQVIGGALGSRPERHAMGIKMVLGEDGHKVANVVIEVEVEGLTGNGNTAREISTLLEFKKLFDFLQSGHHSGAGLVRFALGKESRRVFEVGDSILSTINKQGVELVTTPLNTVFNLVGEVAESAHRDGLLWRILRVTIAECLVGDNHLRVGFGSKSAGFE